ncbi:MAG TPA: sigma-E factor regulatory protein RseB domain-containing protein [Candidatus Baltobacteraceae bacterium]|nr:sigma-E factor regulatory protein RseB domain-containing protein [Candidatus Baltobacteraceae bacterium]
MQIRKRAALAAAALSAALCLPLGASVRAQSGGDGTGLLREAVLAYAKYSYVGQIQNTDFGSQRADSVLFRIEHRAPDMTRRWYLAPESLYGDSIISRGDTSYDIDPHTKRVIVMHDDAIDDQVAMDDNFGLLLHNYRAVVGPDDNVAGRRARSVLLVNKYTGETVMRIAVDAETKLVLEKDRYAASGSVAHQMRFENIRYTSSIPKELFMVPKTGYTRKEGPSHGIPSNDLAAVVRTAGFQAIGPKYLPDGFLPVAGDVTDIKGVRTLHILYSDGLRTISLFENARGAAVDMSKFTVHGTKVRSNDAKYVEDGPTTLLAWASGSRHFALVGEISRDELVRIASSVSA